MPRRPFLSVLALPFALFTSACTDQVIGVDPGAVEGTLTVNAALGWQYVSLADSAVITPAPTAAESADWDIAFFASNVTLNGGQAGPGGVTGACICQNETATNDAVLAMTAESQLPAFDAVTTVPAGASFRSDVLTPAINAWFTGTGVTAAADTSKSWLLRLSDSTSFALLRVRQISGASAAAPGIVTLEYRVQANAAAALGPVQTFDVLANTGSAQRIDLNSGAVTTDASAWDISVEGYTIRVNGGLSGRGKGGAVANTAAFATTSTAVTAPNAYRSDTFAGIFGEKPYFRYNLAGDHRLSPNFNVYLIRRGSTTYKLQILDYYSLTGAPRHVTFRWQKLD